MGKQIRGLLDTGSGSSLIRSSFARKLKLTVRPVQEGQVSSLFAAEGSRLVIDGVADITFNVNGLLIAHTVYVVENIAETLIFGTDFLSENQIVIDYRNKVVSLCSDLIRAPLIRDNDRQNMAKLTKTLCIEPGCEKIVNVQCSPRFSNKDVLIESLPCAQFDKFAIARTICTTNTRSHTVARILNCLPHTLVLPKGTKIATVNNINVQRDCEPFKSPSLNTNSDSGKSGINLSPQQLEDFATDYGFRINPDLTPSQRLELLTLLHQYKSCFARNMHEMRRYQNYELELSLTDTKPSFRRQYKLSQDDAHECHRQINEMTECGIIEPTQNSMYQSAIFTVRKSSGQKRAVLDLRAVNDKLEPFLLQLPNMDQLLHALAGQKGQFHTTLDLASGFWQIKLKDGTSRDVTSFCDPVTGLRYRYCVAPFGLRQSAAAMINVLMGVMSPLVSQNIAFIYMDDICIASSDWAQHLERLEIILKTLDINNLSCQPTKTSIAFPSIKFLGYEVSKDGLKITEDRVKIIQSLKPPHDKKSLQKVMGLWQFFRNHCPKFSQSTYNMRKLLKKDAKFVWTEQCQSEFQNIIYRLTHAPILQPLSINKDFFIYTDSSYFGTAFAAFQPADDNPDRLHVVSYGGQALTTAHRSWSVLQIELLGVYHALKTCEHYCRHREVNIFSDNISLVYLKGMAMGSPREKRMATFLMGFRLNFHHVSGKRENTLADSLSRCFEEMTTSEIEKWVPNVDPRDDFLFAISKHDQPTIPENCQSDTNNHDCQSTRPETKAPNEQPNSGWASYGATLDTSSPGRETRSDFKNDGLRLHEIDQGAFQEMFPSQVYNMPACDVTHVCATTGRKRALKKPVTQKQTGKQPITEQSVNPVSENKHEIPVPSIQPADYLDDTYLKNIYIYLTQGKLTNSDKEDRTTLLLAEDFFVNEIGIMYRISLPRGKKATRVQSTEIRLALPQKYLAEVVAQAHDMGHFSKERNFEFLRTRFYAKNLWDAVSGYQKSCDKCQRMKRDLSKVTDKLHSLETPIQPNQMWAVDHMILSRPTTEGDTAIIVFIDAFSKWPIVRLVKNTSAVEAARVFVENIVSIFGLNPNGKLVLNSDKGAAFTSKFFQKICELLNVRLITSASQASQSNGLAESCVKAVKQGLKIFATADSQIKNAIPLIELSLRFQPQTATNLSPYEVIFGRKPCWPIISDEAINTETTFKGDQLDYYHFIAQRLKEIHAGVQQNIEESKELNEQQYNLRHKAQEPNWKIGQQVLISDRKVKANSDKILTRPRYHGSFFITDIVQNEGFGPSYRLVRTSDGRPLRHLISGSRLRAYSAPERDHFHAKYPKLSNNRQQEKPSEPSVTNNRQGNDEMSQQSQNTSAGDDINKVNTGTPLYEPAIKILKEKKQNGKHEFLVLFENKQKCWADRVSPALERAFRISQEQLRNKRRKRKSRY